MFSGQVVRKFCTEHDSIIGVYANIQNDLTREMDVMNKRDFVGFVFKMSYEGISYILPAHHPHPPIPHHPPPTHYNSKTINRDNKELCNIIDSLYVINKTNTRYKDVTWASWCRKSRLVKVAQKIKATHYWLFAIGFHPLKTLNTKSVAMSWRHHDCLHQNNNYSEWLRQYGQKLMKLITGRTIIQ